MKRQHAFLVTSIAFYHFFARACTEIKISRKYPMSLGFSFSLIFLFVFSFSPFSIFFCHSDCPMTKLASSSEMSERASLRQITNFHGVAECSHRKFGSEVFTQISEHFCVHLRLH